MPRLTGDSYILDQPLYDTVQLAAVAGPTTYNFFAVPRGGILVGAVPKGLQHTNLIQAGVLESQNLFTITGISMYIRELAQAGTFVSLVDARQIASGSLEIFIGNVSFFQLPTAAIPAGGAELNYFSNIAPAVTEFKVTNGVQAVQNRYHLTQPIEMENQESLRVTVVIPGAIAAVTDLTLMLHGNMVRPVR